MLAGVFGTLCYGEEGDHDSAARSFRAKLEKADTVAEIESVISEYSRYDFIAEAVVRAEQATIKEIRGQGAKGRFTIKEILPDPEGIRSSVTFKRDEQEDVLAGSNATAVTEFPGDEIPFVMPAGAPRIVTHDFREVRLTGKGSTWVTSLFVKSGKGLQPSEQIPGADGSVHRFAGGISLGAGLGYVFLSPSEKSQEYDRTRLLTFALIKGVGYVYVRGNGRVLLLRGNKISKVIICKEGRCFSIQRAE
jgi:hypothetical protein